MTKTSFNNLHRVEKPRERMERNGAAALKDDELLAILLRTGYKSKDVLALSRDLLRQYPGRALYERSFADLRDMKGVGASRAATILAAWELVRRHFESADGLPVVQTPKDVCAQVTEVRGRKKEHFLALYLNTRNQLLQKEFVSVGTLNASLVHPREVFEPALRLSAASVILVHNHPSGDPTPSEEDRRMTRRLVEAGELLGLEVLDHVVVSASRHYSFQENGEI